MGEMNGTPTTLMTSDVLADLSVTNNKEETLDEYITRQDNEIIFDHNAYKSRIVESYNNKYVRYNDELGRGCYKTVFRCFDQSEG